MARVLGPKDRLDILCVVCYRNLPLPNAGGVVVCDCEISYGWPLVLQALDGRYREEWRAVVRRDGWDVKVQTIGGTKTAIIRKLVASG